MPIAASSNAAAPNRPTSTITKRRVAFRAAITSSKARMALDRQVGVDAAYVSPEQLARAHPGRCFHHDCEAQARNLPDRAVHLRRDGLVEAVGPHVADDSDHRGPWQRGSRAHATTPHLLKPVADRVLSLP